MNLKGKNSSVTLQYSKSLRKWTVLGYATTEKQVTRKFHAIGINDIERENSGWGNFDDLEIEITPTNSTIYLTFYAIGEQENSSMALGHTAKFRILVDGIPIPKLEIRAIQSQGFFNASLPMYPLEVTPGKKIIFKVQWSKTSGAAHNFLRLQNHPSNPGHRRYLTIID